MYPPETGTGVQTSDIIYVWAFNYGHDDCVKIAYTGQGGNANRFPTYASCRNNCNIYHKFPSSIVN